MWPTVHVGQAERLHDLSHVYSPRCERLDYRELTQESSLVEHSESILRLTVYTAALLIVISAAACLAVALVVGRSAKGQRRSAERYEVLADFRHGAVRVFLSARHA